MKKKKRMTAVLGLALCLFFAFPAAADKKDLQNAEKKKTALEQERKKTEKTLDGLEGLKNQTTAYVKKLDESLSALGDELAALSVSIQEKEVEIEAAEAELEQARQTEKRQYEAMKLRIKYMYERGDTSFFELLMEEDSLSGMLNKAEYIAKISEYDRRMLDAYANAKEQAAAWEEKLKEERDTLWSMQAETEAKHTAVEEMLLAKQREIRSYEAKISEAKGQLSEYEKAIEAQENAIRAIEAEIKRKEEEARKAAEAAGRSYKTVSLGDIKFTWPCPSSSRVTSEFGDRESPTEGASSNHKGIDIGAPTGTNIVAAAAGTVAVSTYSASAGNYIMLSHGGGVYTVYMHASKLLVAEGQTVKKGQIIARVGSTGYSTGPHLHFGIRVNGTYVNPRQYVSP